MTTPDLSLDRATMGALPGRIWRVAWRAGRLFTDDQGLSWAGAIGLYLFLSVPPFMVAVTLVGRAFVGQSQAENFIVEQVSKYLPAERGVLEGILAFPPGTLPAAVISFFLLLFSGSRGFAALASAVNVMWQRIDDLTFWRRQLLRLGMLVVALALVTASALAEAGIAALGANGTSSGDIWLLEWQLLPMLLLGAFLFVAFKVLPREPVEPMHAAIGAVLATVGIRIAQAGLGYMAEAGTFQTPYGLLADVALMATWAWVIGVIVLYAAALVAVLEGKDPDSAREDGDRFTRSTTR